MSEQQRLQEQGKALLGARVNFPFETRSGKQQRTGKVTDFSLSGGGNRPYVLEVEISYRGSGAWCSISEIERV